MKLKKIASLALAGVMAVSMLAGCATKAPTTEDPTTEPEVNYSQEVGKLIANAPEYVTFKDSADLDKALKDAVEYAGTTAVLDKYFVTDLEEAATVGGKLGITLTEDQFVGMGTNTTLATVEKNAEASGAYTVDPESKAYVWGISTAIGENAIKHKIADAIKEAVVGYKYSVVENNGTIGGNFNFTYTVSVSTCTKTVNSSVNGSSNGFHGAADPSVTFIAVQVTRTATHQ